MNIPSVIKDLYALDTYRQNMRIHFPNGERPDICNDNIEAESVSISESVCSGNKLKFGLCEASSFECTVCDIEKKYLCKKTASGESITVKDGIKAPLVNMKIYGKSEQAQTPTPQNPQTIRDVVNPQIVSLSKNLFPKNEIVLSAGNITNLYDRTNFDAGYFKADTTYTVSADVKVTAGTFEVVNVRFMNSTLNKDFLYQKAIIENGKIKFSFKTTAEWEENKIAVLFYCGTVTHTENKGITYSNIQIEEGETVTDYVPYESSAATSPYTYRAILGDAENHNLEYDGKYFIADTDEKVDGVWKHIQRVGVYEFTGNEGILKTDSDINHFSYYCYKSTIGVKNDKNLGMCTHFKIAPEPSSQNYTNCFNLYRPISANNLYLTFGNGFFGVDNENNNASYVRAWLKAQKDAGTPVTVYYALAEPVITDIEDSSYISSLETYNGTTHIYTEADVKLYLEVDYECNDTALGAEIIRNPNPYKGNIKRCEIEVSLEIDVSDLTVEEQVEYAQTAEDVPYPFYRIPIGVYVVESCKKQTNMDKRRIVAYDKLNAGVLDRNILPLLAYRHEISGDIDYYDGLFPHSLNLANGVFSLVSILNYCGMDTDIIKISKMEFDNLEKTGKHFVNKDDVGTNFHPVADTVIPDKEKTERNHLCVATTLSNKQEVTIPCCIFKTEVEYDMAVVAEFNRESNRLNGTSCTVEERLREFKQLPVKLTGETTDMLGNPATGMLIKTYTGEYIDGREIPEECRTGYFEHYGCVAFGLKVKSSMTVEFDGKAEREVVVIEDPDNSTIYNIVKAIKFVHVDSYNPQLFVNGDVLDKIEYYPENNNSNIESDKLTARNVLTSALELNGLFGTVSETGLASVRKLGGDYHTLSEVHMLSDRRTLNYSDECRIGQGEEASAWYDTDEAVDYYGKVAVKSANGEEEAANFAFSPNKNKYLISGNVLLDSGIFSMTEIYDICKNLYSRIQGIRVNSLSARLGGLPDRKAGDRIVLNDDRQEIATYIMQKNTEGIIGLMDDIDSTNFTV